MGSGPQKNHRTVHPDDQMTHCLHVDLAGPFDSSVACYHYFAVGALRLPDLPLLFHVELLETRSTPEITRALSRMINRFEAMEFEGFHIGSRRVLRLHTDRARELTS
eukprot:783258-Amphidinium_carterae.1